MDGGVGLDLGHVAEEVGDRGDHHAALVAARRRRRMRRDGRKRLVAFEGDQDVLVAHEALAGETMPRRHVVDLGVDDLGLGNPAELPQHFLFFFRERDRVPRERVKVLHLDQARAAFAVLTVERNRNLVGLGERKYGAAVARDGVNRDVPRHGRGRKSDIGHNPPPGRLSRSAVTNTLGASRGPRRIVVLSQRLGRARRVRRQARGALPTGLDEIQQHASAEGAHISATGAPMSTPADPPVAAMARRAM